MTAPALSRLCPHVATRSFRSGHRHLDLDLKAYAKAFNDGDETVVFVLVEEGQVIAYVAISDLVLVHQDRGPVRCFAIPAIAVDEEHRGSNSAMRLANRARRVLDLRQEAHLEAQSTLRYDGVACVPWTKRLSEALERLGFEPVDGEIWWFRPWPFESRST
ncbi:MAG: GNAT family N-acetyltransferase [Terriglobales bacterium]